MDPGARASLAIGVLAAVAVMVAAALMPPLAPLLALAAGATCGTLYITRTRREITGRPGQGGIIAAPPIVLGQGIGTALNLLLMGGSSQLGSRFSVMGDGSGGVQLPLAMVIAVILLVVLLDLVLVLVGAEFTARRAMARRSSS